MELRILPVVCHELPNSLKPVNLKILPLSLRLRVRLRLVIGVGARELFWSRMRMVMRSNIWCRRVSIFVCITGIMYVRGEPLVDGPLVPHDILRVKGELALQEYLLNEVQQVYRAQSVRIDDKHIEILVSQMLNKVQIVDPGDTSFLITDTVSKVSLKHENAQVESKGGKPASYEPVLQGVARASLSSDSVIAAASFQETTKVLTDAAIAGRIDPLRGLKENVSIGRLIPAGTGIKRLRDATVRVSEELVAADEEIFEPEEDLTSNLEL